MGLVLLAAFIGIPLIEIGLFIQVGEAIGLWSTIAVVILTAIVGTALLRHQGFNTLTRVQNAMNQGEMPMDAVFDGFCLLAAGLLLLTPGFFTDAIGFLLFTPPLRALLRRTLASRIQLHSTTHGQNSQSHHAHASWQSTPPDHGDIIDGDFTDVTEVKDAPKLDQGPNPRT
ncbi:MAG: FxsA family protein [Magnetovibrio sp.]|nr:FxsA family protein [Magnetovibrio sp.]